ncbi:MAG: hypothetical protein ABI411_00610 [Tahibacter sp.]
MSNRYEICLVSTCNTDTPLCLAVNVYDAKTIIVDNYVAELNWLRWLVDDLGNNNIALWHPDTKSKLVASEQDGSLSLRAGDIDSTTSYAADEIWSVARIQNSTNFWKAFSDGAMELFGHGVTLLVGGYAMRPSFNTDRNLNVLGNGPYNPNSVVAAWDGWSGGAANERWLPAFIGAAPATSAFA